MSVYILGHLRLNLLLVVELAILHVFEQLLVPLDPFEMIASDEVFRVVAEQVAVANTRDRLRVVRIIPYSALVPLWKCALLDRGEDLFLFVQAVLKKCLPGAINCLTERAFLNAKGRVLFNLWATFELDSKDALHFCHWENVIFQTLLEVLNEVFREQSVHFGARFRVVLFPFFPTHLLLSLIQSLLRFLHAFPALMAVLILVQASFVSGQRFHMILQNGHALPDTRPALKEFRVDLNALLRVSQRVGVVFEFEVGGASIRE